MQLPPSHPQPDSTIPPAEALTRLADPVQYVMDVPPPTRFALHIPAMWVCGRVSAIGLGMIIVDKYGCILGDNTHTWHSIYPKLVPEAGTRSWYPKLEGGNWTALKMSFMHHQIFF